MFNRFINLYKKRLRKKFLTKRKDLSPQSLKIKSSAIQKELEKFITKNETQRGKTKKAMSKIMFFAPIHNEVDLFPLVEKLLDEKSYEIYFPKVESISKTSIKKEIFPYKINSLNELKPGFKGILEPEIVKPIVETLAKPQAKLKKLSYNLPLDLVVVPGLAFASSKIRLGKIRLGYGGGFYDRYLKKFPPKFSIGVFFSLQKANFIPHHRNDIKINQVITENKIY